MITLNAFLHEALGTLLVLWVLVIIFVVIPLTVIAQLWAFIVALRQRQWLKTILLATPFGYFYLGHMAVTGPHWKGILGFVRVPGEPRFISLFKLGANIGGVSALILLLFGILLRSLQWAISH